MSLCVVAMRNPHTSKTEFYISKTHLFGLSAAVIKFNRLPELTTAICRRIGCASSWHFFDDQGTLDFEGVLQGTHNEQGMSASELVDFVYKLVGRPFKKGKRLPPSSTQVHLGFKNELTDFQHNEVMLELKPRKLQDILEALLAFRSRDDQLVSLGEIMTTAGKLICLLMSCFNKMARGGLQPFFQWLSDSSAYSSTTISDANVLNRTTVRPRLYALTDKFKCSSSLAIGMELFIRGIPLLEPRIYRLGEIRLPPLLFYSDAEWTVLDKPPWLSKGLGGIMWQSGQKSSAAAVDTPQRLVDGLSPRKTQIILLELMAAAGMLYTYQDRLRGQDVIFFIDNQSIGCALVKGCSRSCGIQLLATSWQLLCLQLGCRVWIEWVPSESNPADILSREGKTLYATKSGLVDPLLLPPWADVASSRDIRRVFDAI